MGTSPSSSNAADSERAGKGEFPDVLELIPHEPPIVVIDRMVTWKEGFARCECDLTQGRMFVERGHVDVLTTIEHMGQTLAACLGYEAFLGGEGVRVGMIIACRRMQLHTQRIAAPGTLVVEATRIRGSEALSHFECTTRLAGELVSEATLTVFHADEAPQAD